MLYERHNLHLLHRYLLAFISYFFTLAAVEASTVDLPPASNHFTPYSRYSVCFTPGNNCTQMIVEAIDRAQHSIYVQAYSFTAQPIMHALIRTKTRGIQINILLDKSNLHGKYSMIKTLAAYHIPYLIDQKPAIAHNKVMIIDETCVITGSFNFTHHAQNRNAENALMIVDKQLAAYYLHNFKVREQQSVWVPVEHAFRPKKTAPRRRHAVQRYYTIYEAAKALAE